MPVEFNWSEPGLTEFLVVCFNLGNLLAVIAFMVRGAISLRMLTVVGALLQALFYAFVAQDIITYGLFWKSLTAVIAFAVVLVIVRERMGRQFPAELRGLAQELRLLNPGQIEKLFKVGDLRVAEMERCIISQGARPDELFYLLDGKATVLKDGRPIFVEAATFLGEIAFVSGGVATADVLLAPGSRYMAWPVDRLSRLLAKDDQIDIALRGLINHDLARKVSAQPVGSTVALKAVAE
jgi:hypothetical protein